MCALDGAACVSMVSIKCITEKQQTIYEKAPNTLDIETRLVLFVS